MPFTPNHLSLDDVEARYTEKLRWIEDQELQLWLHALGDPSVAPRLAGLTRWREAVESDLARSREAWAKSENPPEE